MLILFFLIISVAIGALTYYGRQVGNFVVGMTQDAYSRGIGLTLDLEGPTTSQLVGGSLSDAEPIFYNEKSISYNTCKKTLGTYESMNYMSYSFYLVNSGDESVNVDCELEITGVTKHLDNSLRVWVFDDEGKSMGTIYQKKDDQLYNYTNYPNNVSYFTDPDNNIIYNSRIKGMQVGEARQFTFIFWIEASDPDCQSSGEKSILGATIKFGVNFRVVEDAELA